jgi:hypothetical protein
VSPLMTAGIPRKVFMSVDAVGGVWTYALELAAALASEGVEIDLAVLGPPPSETQRARAVGVPGLRLSVTGLALDWTAKTEAELDRIAWELREAATACGADLVHLNAPAHAGFVQWDLPLAVAAHSCVATWWRAVRGGPLPPDLACCENGRRTIHCWRHHCAQSELRSPARRCLRQPVPH